MPQPDQLVVRMIVWEGVMPPDKLQQQIKKSAPTLRDSLNYVFKDSQWRYQMFKAWSKDQEHKLEIRIQHPRIPGNETHAEINRLCSVLLATELTSNLRALEPSISYTFCPSREGAITPCDSLFIQYFCKNIVECFCLGAGRLSRIMEDKEGDFLFRNNTKYIHQPMVAIYNAADITIRYSEVLDKMLNAIDLANDSEVHMEKRKAAGEKVVHSLHPRAETNLDERDPHISKTKEQNSVALRWQIAIACQCVRAFKGFAPEIKKELQPLISKLNNVITDGRLVLAKEAYLKASTAPIEALEHLQAQDNPSSEDLAMTVNAFGTLMQSTMPLFEQTLVITDSEFSQITGLSTMAGIGICAAGGGGIWYGSLAAGASVAGPIGMMVVGGGFALGFGIAAISEGIKWGKKEGTSPSNVLQSIQKSLEECSLFIHGLIFMAAEQNGDDAYQGIAAHLKDQVQNELYTKPGYMRAYYKNVTLKLAKDMKDLSVGLARYEVLPASS